MEIESEEGAKISIENGSTTEIGRDLGIGFRPYSTDRSVSRRHLSLQPITDPNSPNPVVSFEVNGKNPILVHTGSGGGERIYRKSERGELRVGDKFALSLKNPSFFAVKAREEEGEEAERRRVLDAVKRREKRTLERRREKEEREERNEEEFDLEISEIDPVKEFGFLVKGHEFDQCPKINFKHWNWFLDEPGKNDDSDETDDEQDTRSREKRGGWRKKKKGYDGDADEVWTGESEEEVLMKGGSGKRPKYSTRSKDPKEPRKDAETRKDEVEEEDEDERSLGGFIVNEEDEEEEEMEEGESEEDFEEEEDEDE